MEPATERPGRDPWERVVTARQSGIYESNYLKANSPDGRRGLWIKHNLLRPRSGPGLGEFWVVIFERDRPPRVAKREVELDAVRLSATEISIACGDIELTPQRAAGALADVRWTLRLSGGLAPLHHLPWDWMYRAAFPKKKALTPAPNLRLDGLVQIGLERWEVAGWVGLRGHNWGSEHAWTYGYGNCNLWDDGVDRTVDGFSARIRVGGRVSPLLTSVVSRGPDRDFNHPRHWLGGSLIEPERWRVGWGETSLEMTADRHHYAGLRYRHPDGSESYCYNSKFARVDWRIDGAHHTSQLGELEVLFPEPLDGVLLHPDPGWRAQAGDYRSER